MESFKNVLAGIFLGFWDSISGMKILFYIDNEMHKLEEAKEQAALERRRWEHSRRSPSPTPSSASSMERLERERIALLRKQMGNPDERTLESLRKSSKPDEEEKPKREKKIAKKVLRCCLLNGGFTWLSIVLFEYVLLPVLKFVLSFLYGDKSNDLHNVWEWLHPILTLIFGMMWVLPIFLLSKIVSSMWFSDIANAAYLIRKGRPKLIPRFSKLIADFLFSLIVQALFLVQSMVVNMFSILYIGPFLSFVHLCLLYSLYSFEYKWFNSGWELSQRLLYIESNWPYFLGFGVPLTFLTNLSSSVIVSGCIFSMFFPLFILSSNEAKPVVGTTQIPLRLFVPVVYISSMLFGKPREKKINPSKDSNTKHHQQYDSILTKKEQNELKEMQEKHYRELAKHTQRRLEQMKEKNIPSKESVSSFASSSNRYFQVPTYPKHTRLDNPFVETDSEASFPSTRLLKPTPVPDISDTIKNDHF